MSAREAFKRGLEGIDALYKDALDWEAKRKDEKRKRLIQLGLEEQEAEIWLNNEPDFTKRIATPLGSKRKGSAIIALVLLTLVTQHMMFQARVPNELPHPYPPNNNDALPCFG